MNNHLKIIDSIRGKNYNPVYFLYGFEPFFIDEISKFIEKNVLSDDEKAFNQIIFYGKDTDIETVITTSRRYPVMSKHQVIIVREAQNLAKIEKLQTYLSSPTNSTILVICYKNKSIDKRTKLAKLVKQKGVLFEGKKLYDNQIPTWIQMRVKNLNCEITPKATMMLTNFLGNSLSKIENELKKLLINIGKTTTINSLLVEKYIGISKDFNIFELQNAIGKKNNLQAQRIAKYFSSNKANHPIVATISILFQFFKRILIFHISKRTSSSEKILASKLGIHPFFLKEYRIAANNYSPRKVTQVISLLRAYDLKSKGQNSASIPEGEILRELIFKIIH